MTRWPVERLIDLARLVDVHGTRHPELGRIATSFDQVGRDLLQHLMKEERVLFPYIRELAATTDDRAPASPFGTVENPIRMMEREHRVCFAELARFERDLHRHVHLENNVLFPKAVALERGVTASSEWRREETIHA